MDYTEVCFYNDVSLNDAIIAWLSENDFDMFEERTDGVNAYIEAKRFSDDMLKEVLQSIPDSGETIRYETKLIKDQNWNTKWESNFEPVVVAGQVLIRAPFHSIKTKYPFEIIIEPKMSFGTGHHESTALMIELILQSDLKDKNVLDMGSGTGILAILAEKSGAGKITAIDIEEWAFANCMENCQVNNAARVSVLRGDVRLIKDQEYDVIFANINRNILLSDMPHYIRSLNNGGEIFLSGILKEDKEVIEKRAVESGLTILSGAEKNNWIALHYKKN